MQQKELFILSPFEIPDVKLVLETQKTGAFPILHLGRNKSQAKESLDLLAKSTKESFGVCFVQETTIDKLPSNVTKVFYPYGVKVEVGKKIEKYCQVHSLEEADNAIAEGITNLVIKGSEGAGKVSGESSFILFQKFISKYADKSVNLYIQGGTGIHSSAAIVALGAKGVVMDSQIALFPECSLPKEIKNVCSKLSGSETAVIDGFRILKRNNSPELPVNPVYKHVVPHLGGLDFTKNYLPMGQDIALSVDFFENYKKLSFFVSAFYEAAYGHLQQAKNMQSICAGGKLAQDLGMEYPIAQGPMARVSDVPEFAKNVADAGALPFIAMSLVRGDAARELISETKKLLKDKVWGIGILGFIPAQLRDEQTKYIIEAKPPVVLIAGGRPSLAKPFEKEGIKAFLHVPSTPLLDMFLKEKSKNFIFEGRESGGHVGPLFSMILWERQINRLLKEENLSTFSVFFAGGIHDAFSSAFVSIMSATLSAKGAKVGVLMGSSYLYTKEAVESGAILSQYQKQVIDQKDTILLEAAPGQETQSVKSPYTDFFQKEKKKLQSEYSDSKEVWMRLEELNLGRARIAAKGIERIGTDLVKLNDKEQVKKGLYMVGQVASLRNEVITMKELHTHVAVDNNKLLTNLEDIMLPESEVRPLDVAIVGISGIFPDAVNIEEYWKNIVLGKNCIIEVPDTRWNKDLYYKTDNRDTDYVVSKWGGYIPAIDFDPLEFGMTPQSLASIEPTQLLSLLVAKQALTDAGYTNLTEVDLDNTSVIFGAEGATELAGAYGFRGYAKQVFGELPEELKNSLPKLNEDSFAGVLSNVISGRIANRLNLGGRNYTVDAACASSLAALDLGCQELYSKRSDMVLLGGADLHNGINDFLMFSCTHALSKKGYSASFDADSDGIALGEGIGVLVMKRLEDAERDGNKIYAVIKGMGGSSDGKSLGMTAPNRKGQMKALQRAYQSAGILPSQVGMIEAHGTGTVVGDRTELVALTDMFLESGATKGQTLLGSVKTQIGHAKCAAGIAGVIKTALSLHYGVLPPILHLNKPNPFYDKDSSPFVFNTQAGIWNEDKRVAGVSAFGFGGTNFHVVMENYNPDVSVTTALPSWPSELFVFRGKTPDEAKTQMRSVKTLLGLNDTIKIKDVAYSLAIQNSKEIQVSIVATDNKELQDKIEAALAGKTEYGIYYKDAKVGKTAFLFSGQGSQRVNMARDLFIAFPAMRRLLSQHKEYEKILFPNAVFDDESRKLQQATITDTRNAQPLLGIVDLAIADFLRSLGIEPDMVAGHSYGEIPALCFAGAFSPDDLVSLSRERAMSILNAVGEDKGKMVAVNIPEADLNKLLEGEKEVWAVNFNSRKQTVLAGSTVGMTAFMQKMADNNVGYKELNVASAFHSPLLAKSKSLYANVLKGFKFNKLSVPVWSNTTAELYPVDVKSIKSRLSEHLVKPVLFTKEVEAMYAGGARVFIETGPGRVLTGLVQSILNDDIVTIETENKGINGVSFMLHAIAKYIATGRTVDMEKLFESRNASVVDIENPEVYAKKPTTWSVNGHNAVPLNGKMPAHGAYPITKPLMDLNNLQSGGGLKANAGVVGASDQILLEYLGNMRTMLQTQRDVMLGYMGCAIPVAAQPVQQSIALPVTSQNGGQMSSNGIKQPQPKQPVTATAPAISMENIKELLLDIVSEKTGYPVDMLGLDLDLEADLSIDSIKRMEIVGALRDKLNITGNLEESEDALEKMISVKTLNGLITWIKELAESNKGQLSQQPSQSQVAVNERAISVVQPIISAEQIKNLLLETISEKTGYPVEMLGLDLDLEADLSIDSIKRMEIVGALRDKLNITGNLEESEGALEKMISVKTLNGLITWMEELANDHKSEDIAVAVEVKEEPVEKVEEEESLLRLRFNLEEKELDSSEPLQIDGKRFALTNDGGTYSKNVKKLLESKGASVDLIIGDEDLSQYDGLIILNASRSPKKYSISKVFNMIKSTDLSKIKWIYTFSDLLGNIETVKGITELRDIQGFPGFIKSLSQEFPNINFRAVVFHSIFDNKTLPQIVIDELLTKETTHIEIIYKGTDRYFYNLKQDDLTLNGTANLELEKDSTIVVFGGAQGITPELISQLAKEYPCRYILVGRSEMPTAEDDKYMSLESKDAIRKYLIQEEKMRQPAAIEKKVQRIYKMNQIRLNVRKIEASGAEVIYRSLDIKNDKALRSFIQELYDKYGKIDGVIHAAGLLDDKLFIHKTADSFEQIYSTKVAPFRVLLEELRPDIKLFVMFSSVASTYGNRGQTDYASANSVFDLVASLLSERTNTRILTINWGPWKGAGMVSDTLEEEFKKRGVSLIPLKAGAQSFVNELKYGKETRVLVMGGSEVVSKLF